MDGAITKAKMDTKRYLREDDVIRALRVNHGLITQTATALGCSRNGLVKFLRKRPHLCAVQEQQVEIVLDVAESNVMNGIYSGDDKYTRWFLAHRGQKRGYVTRQEVSGPDGGAVPFTMIERVPPMIDLEAEDAEIAD
jgi:hypothetical protein